MTFGCRAYLGPATPPPQIAKEFADQDAAAALNAIAHEDALNGRIRRNMMDTRRAVSFLMRGRLLNSDQFEEARQILRDIEWLDGHTSFLFDKVNFLMDATVGLNCSGVSAIRSRWR